MMFVKGGWIANTTLLAMFVLMLNTGSNTAFLVQPNQSSRQNTASRIEMTLLSGDHDEVEVPKNDDNVSMQRRKVLTTTSAAATTMMFATILGGRPQTCFATDPLHKVDYPIKGKCGQADNVPENAVFFVKNMGGFKDGSCATEGYDVSEGTAKGTGEKDKEREYSIYGK